MKWIPWQFFYWSLAIDLPLEEIVDELSDYDERFRIILQKHLAFLGLWSILNFFSGLIGLFITSGVIWYFLIMNISWAIINYAIVVGIFNHAFYQRFIKGTVFKRFQVQRHMEKMLLLNIGLDTAYIFAGLYLKTIGYLPEIRYPEMWLGFGWSVIMQGVFLFSLDNIIHVLHYQNFKKAKPFLEGIIKERMNNVKV